MLKNKNAEIIKIINKEISFFEGKLDWLASTELNNHDKTNLTCLKFTKWMIEHPLSITIGRKEVDKLKEFMEE